MLRTAYIVCAFIVITASAWAPYLLGFGGDEHVVITGLLFVFGVWIAACGIFIAALVRFIVALLQQRRVSGVIRLVCSFAVVCLTIVLPQFVAVESRKLGASHRLQRAGGDSAYAQLTEASLALLNELASMDVPVDKFPVVFNHLGVKRITIHKGPPAFIDAVTSGRPFGTGWLIYPNADAASGKKGVEVRPGVYRY